MMAELEYEEVTDPIALSMIELCQGRMPAAEIILKKSGVATTKRFVEYYTKIKDFEVREDDVWVISFPKCGTTWTQEMVWLLANNLDYEGAKKMISRRFPFFEVTTLFRSDLPEHPDTIPLLHQLPSPRFIKSHLAVELLPQQLWTKKPKIIYVTRNPRDVAISYFHHFTRSNNYKGSQDEFIDAFLADRVISSPFWGNVLGFWKKRHEPNILFNTFEEMKMDLRSVLRRTASFLGVSINEEQENILLKHLNFESMKNNSAVNYELPSKTKNEAKFMREGKSGYWKKILIPAQVQRFENWNQKWLEGTDCDLYN